MASRRFVMTMARSALALAGVAVCALLAAAPTPGDDDARYWPQWRGPLATGVAPHGDPPTEWSESENVAWKVEIPGRGHSTPVVWGDRVFLTTAIAKKRPFSYLVLLDPANEVGRLFEIAALPHLVVIDRRGVMTYSEPGRAPLERVLSPSTKRQDRQERQRWESQRPSPG